MTRPKLLDLFCGAGGAAMGYHRAGFDVVGVDQRSQPRYPFAFVQADALLVALDGFDVIHASPPCQAYTTMSNRWRGTCSGADGHPDLLGEMRARLHATGRPYVIENVPGARPRMRSPLALHGGMFGLGVHRPRLFEISVPIGSAPRAETTRNPLGVYGRQPDGRRLFTRQDGTIQRAARGLEAGSLAMGIDWMDWHELTEAIPPAYTEWIGCALLAALQVEAVA